MKNKNLILMFTSIFVLVFSLAFVSSALLAPIIEYNIPTSVVDTDLTFEITFNLTNMDTNGGDLYWTNTIISNNGNADIDFNINYIPDGPITVPVIATITFDNEDLAPGIINGTINASVFYSQSFSTLDFSVNITDTTAPVITLNTPILQTINVFTPYTELDATALDNFDDVITTIAIDSSDVNTDVLGTYTVDYSAIDSSFNTGTNTRIVNVVDITAPVITLTGANPQTIEVKTAYVELGAYATDNVDGNILINNFDVDISAVNFNVLGNYQVIYNVNDSSENSAPQKTRTVNIVDTTAPVIASVSDVEIAVGSSYVDVPPTATDNYYSNVIVTSSGTVDTSTAGTYTIIYTASDFASPPNIATPVTRTVTVTEPFCSLNSYSDELELNVEIDNKGTGDNDKWNLLDTIGVEVKFENNWDSDGDDTYDLEDVVFELSLLDDSGHDVADDLIWLSEDEEEFEFGDVDEKDDAEHTFIFRINPEEFTDGNYDLIIKVSGDDDNNDKACIDFSDDLNDFGFSKYYADIEIKQETDKDKMIIVDTESLGDLSASCEQQVMFTVDVWNIGDNDFDDNGERVKVTLYNEELGINTSQIIDDTIKAGDMDQVTFTFTVPTNMDEKTYDLEMKTYYDYDEDDDDYDEVSDETFTISLDVAGNCVLHQASITNPIISEGGEAGETLIINVTITNTGKESSDYTFGVSGFSGWADSAKVNVSSLTLAPGESGEISISFEVERTAKGEQTFKIGAYSEGLSVSSLSVNVPIEGKKGLGAISGNNALIALLIGLIIVVAVVIIIVLIVRASKKSKAKKAAL